MKLTKDQQNQIAIAVVAVVLIGLFIFKVLLPLNKKIDEKNQKLVGLINEIAQLQLKSGQLDLLKNQNAILNEEITRSEKKLPSKEELANLLRFLTETSRITGVDIQNFRPLPPESKQYYKELPFSIDATGNYHSFAQFINTVNQTERIIAIKDLVINSNSSEETSETIRCTMRVVTYMVNK